MTVFATECYSCHCPQYSEGKECPCECHEAFAKVLSMCDGDKDEAVGRLELLKKLVETDKEFRHDYLKTRFQRDLQQKFKNDNR